MRLVRVGEPASKVGADVRAALASWGRGDSVVGGIALVGVQPPDCPSPVDAVLVLPKGVLVVVGVELPDPAVRLDAPLGGQWKTDGWPLVRPDGAVNPGQEALKAVSAIQRRLEEQRTEPLPVALVIAIGPYVSQVSQPTTDLLRGVRILHPEPMTLLTATRELAVHQRPCTVEQAKAVLAALGLTGVSQNTASQDTARQDTASQATVLDQAALRAEGFPDIPAPALASASTTLIPKVTDPLRRPGTAGGSRRGGQLRWLPVGAAALVALLLLTGVVFAVLSAEGSSSSGATGRDPGDTRPAQVTVEGMAFTPKGVARDTDCANHAYGDVQAWLGRNRCGELIRLRFETGSADHTAAVLVAVLRFADSSSATELRLLADKPGSGAVADLTAGGVAWPDGGKPFFESSAYASGREGNSVKLVQVVWLNRQASPDDPTLTTIADRALGIPIP